MRRSHQNREPAAVVLVVQSGCFRLKDIALHMSDAGLNRTQTGARLHDSLGSNRRCDHKQTKHGGANSAIALFGFGSQALVNVARGRRTV